MTDKREGGTPRTDATLKPDVAGRLWLLVQKSINITGDSQRRTFAGFCDEIAQLERELQSERERGARERAAGFEEARERAVSAIRELENRDGPTDRLVGYSFAIEAIAALRQEGKK